MANERLRTISAVRWNPEVMAELWTTYEPFVVDGLLHERSPWFRELNSKPHELAQLDWITEQWGDVPISFNSKRGAPFFPDLERSKPVALEVRTAPFPQFASQVKESLFASDLLTYARGALIPAPLCEHFSVEGEVESHPPLFDRSLWIGSGGHDTPLHFDGHRNVVHQYCGTKRWTMFPPWATHALYPTSFDHSFDNSIGTLVGMASEEAASRFPRLHEAFAQGVTVELEAGQTLVVPPLWWHCVSGYGFNVMSQRWYQDIPQYKHMAFLRYVMSEIPNPDGHSPDDCPMCTAFLSSELGDVDATRSHYWRKAWRYHLRFWVDNAMGDPHPTLPGELEACRSRLRWLRGIRISTTRELRRFYTSAIRGGGLRMPLGRPGGAPVDCIDVELDLPGLSTRCKAEPLWQCRDTPGIGFRLTGLSESQKASLDRIMKNAPEGDR